MRTHAQGRADAKRHAARRGDLVDDTADRASPIDPRRRGLGVSHGAFAQQPQADHDAVTPQMIARLAQRLWEMHGGNAVLNWLEAEQMLQDLLAPRAQAGSSRSQPNDSSLRDSVRLGRKLNTCADLKGAVQ